MAHSVRNAKPSVWTSGWSAWKLDLVPSTFEVDRNTYDLKGSERKPEENEDREKARERERGSA